jgi:hypothetical protein
MGTESGLFSGISGVDNRRNPRYRILKGSLDQTFQKKQATCSQPAFAEGEV